VPFATAGDVSLFFTDDGSGDPPLLFIHGFTCDGHDWSWQIPHFVHRHRVIALDNRGHGRSSVPDTGYGHEDFAADTAHLLDRLGCGPVVAIGHSLGGVIVSTLAIERPDLVRAVVSIDPGYLLPDEVGVRMAPFFDALDSSDPAAAVQAMLAASDTPATPLGLRTWHLRRVAGVPEHVLRQTARNLLKGIALDSISRPYLARRKCPVLALHARPAQGAIEAGLLAHDQSRVVTFEGSGHWIHQERPAEVNHLIDAWLTTLAPQ
jgi:pimeloyl-ACP methyl ester carboxylesterase